MPHMSPTQNKFMHDLVPVANQLVHTAEHLVEQNPELVHMAQDKFMHDVVPNVTQLEHTAEQFIHDVEEHPGMAPAALGNFIHVAED